jgi:hypothetical protein
MKNKYYDAETIYDMQGAFFTMSDDRLRHVIAEVFTRIPADVVDQVIDDCLYLIQDPEEGGTYFPNTILKNKHICMFAYPLFDEPKKGKVFTILHETAHYYLKHKSPFEFDNPTDPNSCGKQYNKQEKEADDLVDKWLKDWENSQAKLRPK